ncbi:unnamed protein product [Fructobacillus fructosus]|jgi:hypothetical protein|uniref:hypothetical protein n=1 Tax=Fructobacillus fructosus TaxID=1631 RepID=UPI002DA5AC8E|nr:unnamed protein product [Fructobacillus fructosus]
MIWYEGNPDEIKKVIQQLSEDEQLIFNQVMSALNSSKLKAYQKNRVLAIADKILYYTSIGLYD